VYSAHDYTLLGFMAALGLARTLAHGASFGAHFLVELWAGAPPALDAEGRRLFDHDTAAAAAADTSSSAATITDSSISSTSSSNNSSNSSSNANTSSSSACNGKSSSSNSLTPSIDSVFNTSEATQVSEVSENMSCCITDDFFHLQELYVRILFNPTPFHPPFDAISLVPGGPGGARYEAEAPVDISHLHVFAVLPLQELRGRLQLISDHLQAAAEHGGGGHAPHGHHGHKHSDIII
jgi:hypothetical protein